MKFKKTLFKDHVFLELILIFVYVCVLCCGLSLQGAFDSSSKTLQEQQSSLKQTALQLGRSPGGRETEQWKKVCACVHACVHRVAILVLLNSVLI